MSKPPRMSRKQKEILDRLRENAYNSERVVVTPEFKKRIQDFVDKHKQLGIPKLLKHNHAPPSLKATTISSLLSGKTNTLYNADAVYLEELISGQ